MGVIDAENNVYKEEILRKKLIKLAILQLGKEYRHGYHGPTMFDCAGLVWFLYYRIYGIDLYVDGFGLSTTTKIMTSSIGEVTLFDERNENKDLSLLKPGDIVFFHRQSLKDFEPRVDNRYPGHCGIYLGENLFIHASYPKSSVIKSSFDYNPYWASVLVASKNIVKDEKVLKLDRG